MSPLKLTGLVAAPHSPFGPDGGLSPGAVDRQVALLVEGGVSAAFVCGTTGEGASLSTAERKALAARWVAAAPPSLPVVVHVGHASLPEARDLAAHARSIGAAAISALAPYFYRPRGVPELVEFCAAVAAAAPCVPFYFYHLPSMTGVALPMDEFLRRARDRIPTFAGIKYTHDDLAEFGRCVRMAAGELDVLFGRDELLLDGMAAGARGAIGSTYNYAAPLYRRLTAAFAAGDLAAARECQAKAGRLVAALRRYGEIPAAKAVMALCGVEVGPPRPPLYPLGADDVAALHAELAGLDIFTRPLATPGR